MPQHGACAIRNAGHRDAQAVRLAGAVTDKERLNAAFDQFRSAASLLGKRRAPRDADQFGNRAAAVRLMQEMTGQLTALAEAIDRGDYDAK